MRSLLQIRCSGKAHRVVMLSHDLSCQEGASTWREEKSIPDSEKSMCKGPANKLAVWGIGRGAGWLEHLMGEGERVAVWQSGRGPDHAGLGKSVGAYSVHHCVYICKNTFVILISPCDAINILFLMSLHRLQSLPLRSIHKIPPGRSLIINYFAYKRQILFRNIPGWQYVLIAKLSPFKQVASLLLGLVVGDLSYLR